MKLIINKNYKNLFNCLITCILITSCSEATFLVNSAKRIGSWGDDPTYKIGNPYKINGKWYYPAVDYDYDETGMASWYGPQFHGKKTANGEIFDQNKISAAHKTLPLPSIVKVTNLDNGRILPEVRINDRGPFAKNRIIDLSKKAAEELGFVNQGVARVRVQILEDESRKMAVLQENKKIKTNSAEIGKVQKKQIKDNYDESTMKASLRDNKKPEISIDFPEDATVEFSSKKRKEVEIDFVESENDGQQIEDEIYFPKYSNKEIVEEKIKKGEIFFTKKDEGRRANLEIQVGAFEDHRNAKSLIEKLSEFEAYIKREFVNEKYLYKVRIGPIENMKIANSIKKRLGKIGISTVNLIMN
tara:strand:- start:757 stop:1830 length:1074 start_codon:yes stop_codon:yes gene_type:complete